MSTNRTLTCSDCGTKSCRQGDESRYPAFCLTKNIDDRLLEEAVNTYNTNEEEGKIARVSASIEKDYYCKMTRVEETIEFIERMGYRKVGIATCVGLLAEAGIFAKLLQAHGIDYCTAGCKLGARDKTEIGIPEEQKLNGGCAHESMCNPIMQAKYLESQGTDFNIVIGLCVGHDSLFLLHSKAPTTVMIVKDRVLGHNPVQALYTAQSPCSRFKKEFNL